jgi:hypothetical protein
MTRRSPAGPRQRLHPVKGLAIPAASPRLIQRLERS